MSHDPYRLAFSSNCTDDEDLEFGAPVAQLAVRSRVALVPFSEWSLLHYYSHDYNGERLTFMHMRVICKFYLLATLSSIKSDAVTKIVC